MCYMFREQERFGGEPTAIRRTTPATWNMLQKRRGDTGALRVAPGDRVFVCSWSDFFHDGADAWRPEAWAAIAARRDVVFQIVTKRPERIAAHLPADWGEGWPHVWLGVSIELDKHADRAARLLDTPAAVRWVSAEPLLGSLSSAASWVPRLDWLVAGGETGWPGKAAARPTAIAWARELRDVAVGAGVPFFWKQWGDWLPVANVLGGGEGIDPARAHAAPGGVLIGRAKRNTTADEQAQLDGRAWREFPQGVAR